MNHQFNAISGPAAPSAPARAEPVEDAVFDAVRSGAAGLHGGDLEALIAAAGVVSGLLDAGVISAKAAVAARSLAGLDLVGIAVREDPDAVVMLGTSGEATEWFTTLRLAVDVGEGFAGTIIERNLPLILDSRGISAFDARTGATGAIVLSDAYAAHLRGKVAAERLTEFVGAPIGCNGAMLGVLYAGNRGDAPISRRSRVLLTRFATMIGPALAAAQHAREAAVREVERERERIASSLHDTLGQILFGIGAAAGRARAAVDSAAGAPHDDLRLIEMEATRASAHLRAALHTLTPPPHAALQTEARILTEMFTRRTGIPADTLLGGRPRSVPADVFSTLVAVLREGLHNIEKHAGASSVIVTLHYDSNHVAVVLQDDGVGLARRPGTGAGTGLGLSSLKRRLERVGGTLVVNGPAGKGTVLRAVV